MIQERTRAVIVEVRGRHAVALTETGFFLRVANEQYQPGQTMVLDVTQTDKPRARRRSRLNSYVSMAAGLLLLVFGGLIGYMAPVGVVSLDVNPSFEYTINCFDRVLDIKAVNDDAKALLPSIDEKGLLYQQVDDVLETTILVLRESGYLNGTGENNVVIAASSYEAQHTEQIAQRLESRITRQSDLTVYSVSVSRDEVKNAHALGTSAGRQYILQHLSNDSENAAEEAGEDWINLPMQRLQRETELHKKAEKISELGESTEIEKPEKTHDGNMNDDNEKNEDRAHNESGEDLPGEHEAPDTGREKDPD